jgi:hypothetical protein
MKNNVQYFEIEFQGVEYEVEVIIQGEDTSVFIQYVNSDEDIEENLLRTLTNYLIEEGFIEYKDIE